MRLVVVVGKKMPHFWAHIFSNMKFNWIIVIVRLSEGKSD